MTNLILVNKPYDTLCQFTDENGRHTLAEIIDKPQYKRFYPAGRLDRDSEGLVLLTNVGALQHAIAHPLNKMPKTYWVQLEGEVSEEAIQSLQKGVTLKDGLTQPAQAHKIDEPNIWPRNPPIRERKNIPTSWISLTLREGKNRQVRRMTASTGFPTLRLIRYSIGPWTLDNLPLSEYKTLAVNINEYTAKLKPKSTYNKPKPGKPNRHF